MTERSWHLVKSYGASNPRHDLLVSRVAQEQRASSVQSDPLPKRAVSADTLQAASQSFYPPLGSAITSPRLQPDPYSNMLAVCDTLGDRWASWIRRAPSSTPCFPVRSFNFKTRQRTAVWATRRTEDASTPEQRHLSGLRVEHSQDGRRVSDHSRSPWISHPVTGVITTGESPVGSRCGWHRSGELRKAQPTVVARN